MSQPLKPSEKHPTDLIIALNAADTDKFIAAVTRALCNGWTRLQDVCPQPDKPPIYRFSRQRPGEKAATICLQQVESDKLHTIWIDTPDPMSQPELTAFIEEFAEDI